MSGYLLDTDISVELLRGRDIRIAACLASKQREEVFLTTVTVAELFFGAHRSANPLRSLAACREFCSRFDALPLDFSAAQRSASIRAHLERVGQRIGAYDLLIAGIAVDRGCVLVTHNTREFSRIPELQLEDWIAEPQ